MSGTHTAWHLVAKSPLTAVPLRSHRLFREPTQSTVARLPTLRAIRLLLFEFRRFPPPKVSLEAASVGSSQVSSVSCCACPSRSLHIAREIDRRLVFPTSLPLGLV